MFAVNSERLNHTITFSADNEIHQQRVFLGWQTPALIQVWMMSSIHYVMIKSLLPTSHPSVTSLLWTRHSSRPHLWWAPGGWGQAGTSLPHSQAAPEIGAWWVKTQWPVRQPVTHNGPAVSVAEEKPKLDIKKRKVLVFFLVFIQMKKIKFSNIKVFRWKSFMKRKKKSGYNTRTMVTNGEDNDFLPGTC